MKNIIKLKSPITIAVMGLIFSFLAFSIFFKLPANASTAGRTLVVHNNTGATLYLLNWSRWVRTGTQQHVTQSDLYKAANMAIPPNSKRSLFNFLIQGSNTLFIYPKKVRPAIRRKMMSVKVTGYERRAKEISIFPRDFGKTVMFDAGVSVRVKNVNLRTGYYRNTYGDSGFIKNLGGGNYEFQLWQGKKRIPDNKNWYNKGTGAMGGDGLIHSTQRAVSGHPSSEYTFEGYWKIISSMSIKLVKYRNYLKKNPPASNTWGWKKGPVYTYFSN